MKSKLNNYQDKNYKNTLVNYKAEMDVARKYKNLINKNVKQNSTLDIPKLNNNSSNTRLKFNNITSNKSLLSHKNCCLYTMDNSKCDINNNTLNLSKYSNLFMTNNYNNTTMNNNTFE